jgi:hypothetical protein
MRGLIVVAALGAALLSSSATLAQPEAAAPPKPPAQYKRAGSFTGGLASGYTVISGIRFGKQDDGASTRMVLDLDSCNSTMGERRPAAQHPKYSIELVPYPYRLVVRLEQTFFDPQAPVMNKPALPFSIVANDGGPVKEIQIFLQGPAEFKVIEIDDPAKLSIDVRPLKDASVPTIYTVQVTDARTPEEAYALVEQGTFPEGFRPQVLVLGNLVVVEQAFMDARSAVQMDASLRSMGYSSVINERRGSELPQP